MTLLKDIIQEIATEADRANLDWIIHKLEEEDFHVVPQSIHFETGIVSFEVYVELHPSSEGFAIKRIKEIVSILGENVMVKKLGKPNIFFVGIGY